MAWDDDTVLEDESPECAICRQIAAERYGQEPDCSVCAMIADELGEKAAKEPNRLWRALYE